jgi:glycosyltransferase involved in cell wall biosynthesis
MSERPLLVHVTTIDMSLALLLGPQLEAFRDAGFDVVGASAPGPYVEQLEARGIRHVAVRNFTRSMAPGRDLAALRELHHLFRELHPTIVHTHNPKPGVYGRLAARAARVPIVVNTVHGIYALPDDPLPKRAVVYGLERLAATCSDAELLQNPEDLPVLERLRVPRRKLHVLGNGIDLTRFGHETLTPGVRARRRAELGVGPDEILCGVVGRLVWEKGYREVFAMAAELRERAPSVRIVVVGPADTDKEDAVTEDDIAAAERIGNVTFLGLRDDVEALYPLMDVYVLASHREGFPRSAMEAAAMGVPVVATDIRGCRQVVDHEVNGLLVPVHDAGALADAVAKLASDPARRAAMAEAAVAKARRDFDDRKVVDITLGVYRELLARRPGRG